RARQGSDPDRDFDHPRAGRDERGLRQAVRDPWPAVLASTSTPPRHRLAADRRYRLARSCLTRSTATRACSPRVHGRLGSHPLALADLAHDDAELHRASPATQWALAVGSLSVACAAS